METCADASFCHHEVGEMGIGTCRKQLWQAALKPRECTSEWKIKPTQTEMSASCLRDSLVPRPTLTFKRCTQKSEGLVPNVTWSVNIMPSGAHSFELVACISVVVQASKMSTSKIPWHCNDLLMATIALHKVSQVSIIWLFGEIHVCTSCCPCSPITLGPKKPHAQQIQGFPTLLMKVERLGSLGTRLFSTTLLSYQACFICY